MTNEKSPFPPRGHQERKVRVAEGIISTILRTGVFASMAVIAAGALITLFRHPEFVTSARAMGLLKEDAVSFPHSLPGIVRGMLLWHGQAFAALGLLLLILTPAARVGASILIFIALRDRLYLLITSVVFILLLASFVVGRG